MKRLGVHILLLGLLISSAVYGADSETESPASSTSASEVTKPKIRKKTYSSRDPLYIPNPFLDPALTKSAEERRSLEAEKRRTRKGIKSMAAKKAEATKDIETSNQKIASIIPSIKEHSSTDGKSHQEAFLDLLTPYMEQLLMQAKQEADHLGIADEPLPRLTHVVKCLYTSEQFIKDYPLLALLIPASFLHLEKDLEYDGKLRAKIRAHIDTYDLNDPLSELEALFPGITIALTKN